MSSLLMSVRISLDDFRIKIHHRFDLQGVTALFGPSGAGKTTLLRIIAGLETNSHGQLVFDNELWQSPRVADVVPVYQRGIGYVFQDARLFAHLNVSDNLAYAERRSRKINSSISASEVISTLELDPLLTRDVGSLSGGERQRVAIARALLTRPRLMLMDEPLSSLDLARKAEILALIERLPTTFGVPVIYVTHAIEEVVRVARQMVVISNGRKIADGPVQEVLESTELQSEIGRFEAGGVLTATVMEHDWHYHLTRLDHNGQSIVMPRVNVSEGTPVRLRIRARDVSLATSRPKAISVRNVLCGVVEEISAETETAFAEVLVDLGGARLRARVSRAAVDDLNLTVGSTVFALIKSASFDRRALSVPLDSGPKITSR